MGLPCLLLFLVLLTCGHFLTSTFGLKDDNVYLQAALGTASCSDENPFIPLTACADRKGCVAQARVCDARDDCQDGSDETESACQQVHKIVCPQLKKGGRFQCKYDGSVDVALLCDGTPDCSDGSDEADCKRCFCERFSSKYFQCQYGACVDREERCDGTRNCPDGSDEEDCTAEDRIPPSTSTTTISTSTTTTVRTTVSTTAQPPRPQSCRLPHHPPHGRVSVVRCPSGGCGGSTPGQAVTHGSVMVTGCYPKYQLTSGDGYSYCDNGVWRPPQHSCLECGVSTKQFTKDEELSLIHHGEFAESGFFPWMAGLYHLRGDAWELVCGGTLINTHIVLTAAHCVTKAGGAVMQPNEVQVALGKLHRDFNRKEDSGVISQVREVVVPKRYVGVARHYDMDVALLDLTGSIRRDPDISPVCLDLSGRLQLRNNILGYLAGWGKNEDGNPSNHLQWTRQQFIDYDTCVERVHSQQVKYISHDKFCIESVRGSKADKGDSGGGLTFTKDGIHFLFGVVSTGLPSSENVVLFTNLTNVEHRDWIRKERRRLVKLHT